MSGLISRKVWRMFRDKITMQNQLISWVAVVISSRAMVVRLTLFRIPRPCRSRGADHLPWAAPWHPGVVLNRMEASSGLFGFGSRPRKRDRGRTPRHLRAGQECAPPLRFGLGALLQAEHTVALGYPDSTFSNPVSWLVDEEGQAVFEGERALSVSHSLHMCIRTPRFAL